MKLSFTACIAIALSALLIGIFVDSITLILDSSKRFIAAVAAMLGIFVIKNIHKSADGRYHFGYSKYEPLAITIECVLLISVCLMSFKFAIADIIHHEDMLRYDIPIYFTMICGVGGLILGSYLKRVGAITNSSILIANGWAWHLDGLFSFGICAGFTVAVALNASGRQNLAHYVDPAMTMILISIIILHPLKTIKHHVLELVDASPGEDVEKIVQEEAEKLKKKYNLAGIKRIRLRKAGRKFFIDLVFSLEEKETIDKIGKITSEINRELSNKFSDFDVLISFDLNKSLV